MTDTTTTTDRPLSKRAVAIVDTRTRLGDPFIERTAVGVTLAHTHHSDPDTTPSTAIDLAVKQDELVALPRPGSGEACLTVRDKRRLAACASRYREAGEQENAAACIERVEREDVPSVLDRAYVTGPPDP